MPKLVGRLLIIIVNCVIVVSLLDVGNTILKIIAGTHTIMSCYNYVYAYAYTK